MNKVITSLVLVLLMAGTDAFACTTAVISGKHTADGRPLLWKHRDTWAIHNKIMQFDDGKYTYVGLVNSQDSLGKSVWIGYNATGFAIMNSASYNLNNDSIIQSGLEGHIIKSALQNCSSLEDFEKLLNDLPLPTRLEANFGVIDGNGGAAYYELSNFTVKKVDANDQIIAPNGYLIRTNFSFSGVAGKGGGYIRYVTANNIFDDAVKSNKLSAQTIVQKASRNLTHGLTNDNLWDYENLEEGNDKMVNFIDYIPRKGSSSSCVVEGIKVGEDTSLTTMWTVLGWPLASVTIPVFINKNGEIPEVLAYNSSIKDAPLCHFALELKEQCFSYNWGTSSKYYININKLLNANKTGILQENNDFEKKLFLQYNKLLAQWRANGYTDKELLDFYQDIDKQVYEHYSNSFGLSVN